MALGEVEGGVWELQGAAVVVLPVPVGDTLCTCTRVPMRTAEAVGVVVVVVVVGAVVVRGVRRNREKEANNETPRCAVSEAFCHQPLMLLSLIHEL